MGFFSNLPGNPLTPAGLEKRISNASPSGKALATALPNFFNSLPGNPLTPAGLRKRVSNQSDTAPVSAKKGFYSGGVPFGGAPSGGAPSGGAPSGDAPSGGAPSQPQLADYLDAPWASAYGMSKETAYAEAMENTAYRRSVADMQRAGLNPAVIFGAGNGYTAGSPSYVRSAGTAGSGGSGYSRRSSGRGRSSGKLFSSSAYATLSVLGGLAGVAATGTAGGYWIGLSLTQGAMSAANLLSRR